MPAEREGTTMVPLRSSAALTVLAVLTVLPLVLTTSGCSGGRSLDRLLDADSSARLHALDAGARVLASLHGEPSPHERLGLLADRSRVLNHTPGAVLVDVTRGELEQLARLRGLSAVVIWGDAAITTRLDPRLRLQMLETLDTGDGTGTAALPVIATFNGDAADHAAAITALGCRVRSTAGSVATLDAPVAAILRVAALPEVRELEQPSTLRPLGR